MQLGQHLRKLIAPFPKFPNRPPNISRNGNGQNIEQLIQDIEIFSQLEPKSIKKLARLFSTRDYPKGELMIKKGGAGLGMFIILSGCAEVFDEQDDKKVSLATLEAGAAVGEMSLISGEPRTANVEVLEDIECLLLTQDSFNGLTKKHAEILWGMVPLLAGRLRDANSRISELESSGRAISAKKEEQTDSNNTPDTAAKPEAKVQESQEETQGAAEMSNKSASLGEGAKEEDMDNETEETEEEEESGFVSSAVQLSISSFMYSTSLLFIGTQEILRLVPRRNWKVSQRLEKSENVVSSLTETMEENMGGKTKKVYDSFQEFLSSIIGIFER